jgi:hypothetical protein
MTRWSAIMMCLGLAALIQLMRIQVKHYENYDVEIVAPTGNKVETMRDVRVLRRIDDFHFRMAVQDPDNREWNEFAFTYCPTYHPTHEIQAGVTLSLLKYEDNKQDSCMDVSRDNLGYILLRGEKNEPILADLQSGQTPSQSTH